MLILAYLKYWWIAVIVILCVIVGWQDKTIVKLKNQHLVEQNKAYEQLNTVSAQYEAEKRKQKIKVETITKTITKTVDRPIYSNVCIDDDGRLQINNLIKQGNTK